MHLVLTRSPATTTFAVNVSSITFWGELLGAIVLAVTINFLLNRYEARLRLPLRSQLADDGTAIEVVITNRGRVGKIIDVLEALSVDDTSVIPGVRYKGSPDGAFSPFELSGRSSIRIVIEAPEDKPFREGTKLRVGSDAGQKRVIRPKPAQGPIPLGSTSDLPSATASPGQEKKIRSPLAVPLLIAALVFSTVAAVIGIVYVLLSGIALKSHQAAFDFSRLERAALQLLLFGIAVGVTAMAVIEVIKRTTPVRAAYHVAVLSRRLGPDSYAVLRDLVTGRRQNVILLDLPIEQLTGQIGAALDQIVAGLDVIPIVWSPEREQGTVNKPAPPLRARLELLNAVVGRQFFVVTEKDQGAPPDKDKGSPPSKDQIVLPGDEKSTAQELRRDLETALRSALDAGLDNVQLSVGSGWKRLVRLSAAAVSAIAALIISILNGETYEIVLIAFLGAFVVGGFFSWLSRDLVAVVERWRQ